MCFVSLKNNFRLIETLSIKCQHYNSRQFFKTSSVKSRLWCTDIWRRVFGWIRFSHPLWHCWVTSKSPRTKQKCIHVSWQKSGFRNKKRVNLLFTCRWQQPAVIFFVGQKSDKDRIALPHFPTEQEMDIAPCCPDYTQFLHTFCPTSIQLKPLLPPRKRSKVALITGLLYYPKWFTSLWKSVPHLLIEAGVIKGLLVNASKFISDWNAAIKCRTRLI